MKPHGRVARQKFERRQMKRLHREAAREGKQKNKRY